MSVENLSLAGKTALVTGGSRGIGAACAKLLAARGAAVVVTYSKSAEQAEQVVAEIAGGGGKGFAVAADAADADAAKAGVAAAVDRFGGRLDILVNNAGIAEHGPIGTLPDAAFERQVDVNIRGVWHTTAAAVAHLGDDGRIINIGSFFSERVPFPGSSAYGMTKHAVAGMTRGWARDLAGRRITVNTVEPGPIETEANPDTGERSARIKTLVPLGRYGQPNEVAELVCFLASPAAAYITGTHVLIDGGMLA
ncbi:SDR family NAD(P)-dependent oxidoreductase [Sphingomonas bacterium]|uniref:SDR family NAD(P)-dependent oxidoreductase n=1 Tax=Sphingomonas bacterium TaxID=1895847 RepID=UPI00157519D3|nr:SDR family oxidoreductase [Sphingomonas bacterium]